MLDAEWIRTTLDLVQFVATIVIAVYVFLTNRHRANKAAIDAVDEKYEQEIEQLKRGHTREVETLKNKANNLDNRLTTAETAIKYMPNDEKFAKLHERMDKFGETLSHLEGSTENMSKTVGLMHQTLMSMDKKQ